MDFFTDIKFLMVLGYIILINIFTFAAFGYDKGKAMKGSWRIPENHLLFFAAVGGSLGAYGGMKYFHHKIRKRRFNVGVPIVLAINVAVFIIYIILGVCHLI